MMISGIVMAVRPEHLAEMEEVVNGLSWADVHYTDRDGRLVVTIDARDVEESMERIRALQGMPRVLAAELAEFTVEEEGAQPSGVGWTEIEPGGDDGTEPT